VHFGVLHHNNAPAHTALSVSQFLASKEITMLEHPPYSLDLAPSDFFIFPKIKEILKGRYSDDIDDISSNNSSSEGHSTKPVQKLFLRVTRRWHQCIASQGEYFKGDHSDIQQ
jgi:histone-lysine N-methyltransferase SETMAR